MTALSHESQPVASLVKFQFHGDELALVPLADGDVGVAMRVLCDIVGVDVDGQIQRLQRTAATGVRWATTCAMQVVAEDGKLRRMVVLPRRSIPMWAATLDVSRVPEDRRERVREKLIRYQDECSEVLADHFLGKRGALPEGALSKEDVQRMALRYTSKMTFLETEKRRIHNELVSARAELDKALDASSALIAARDVDRLKREIEAVAHLMLQLGRCKKPNIRSALLTVRNRVMSRWLGAGKTIDGMPRELVAEAFAALRVMRRDYESDLKRKTASSQGSFFDLLSAAHGAQPN